MERQARWGRGVERMRVNSVVPLADVMGEVRPFLSGLGYV